MNNAWTIKYDPYYIDYKKITRVFHSKTSFTKNILQKTECAMRLNAIIYLATRLIQDEFSFKFILDLNQI